MTDNQRADYISGLRKIADALDADPALPLPYQGTLSALMVFADDRAELAAWARVLGKAEKRIDEDSDAFGFELHGTVGGVRMVICANRDQVCTKRVVAVREVTREVLDPDALAAVPTVTVTETVEDVEWDCGPILAEQVPA